MQSVSRFVVDSVSSISSHFHFQVQFFEEKVVTQVSAGLNHTVALTEDGQVISSTPCKCSLQRYLGTISAVYIFD